MSSAHPEVNTMERRARLDVLTSLVGATICGSFVFFSSRSTSEPGKGPPAVPLHQVMGMMFTCLLCPVVYSVSRPFYHRHRSLLVLLVRVVFAFGTVHNYDDAPTDALSWASFLAAIIYSSRTLIMAWGCFGWQLPFPLHATVQAAHVAAASRLLWPLCTAAPGSFLDANKDKFRGLSMLLDWPFSVVWPPAPMELGAVTSPTAACVAVVGWVQIVLGWLIPTALLAISLGHPVRCARILREHGWLTLTMGSQLLWCIGRVVALKKVK